MTLDGKEFINAKPETVIKYLKNRNTWYMDEAPSNLIVKNSGRKLTLCLTRNPAAEYPLRKTFLYKLLKWYSFPISQIGRISNATAASICNDYLLQIQRDYVRVKFEGDDALTITSPDYNEITDLEIIKRVSDLNIKSISRNDFMMRVTTEDKFKFCPVPGDNIGIGLSILNSETGFRALSVSHFVLRYICTNGAVVKINKENGLKVHYGHKPGSLSEFLNDKINSAEKEKKKLAVSISKMPGRKTSGLEELIRKAELFIGKKMNVTEGMSVYDLFNNLTEIAKGYDLSKRIYLESIAGELINPENI
jgi:hypothetical protein